ncbi:PepSY-associated TM helix domain-containing protein [Novosphingobium album (ex Liu et al. 2023)]|uniref:PepSY-associated TM helix domain-containing protein n=1 Tax=Novosphingobium album (ex Liu et al. 2023) TaxID=3031130 RepID=A0ABT5WN85_9SPHN|nr:PepSY-associated TM helix domain-containing protein [Novosphingobium album (ex Liu et al. 2023)]MDE8651497.1 PepSY-associated TM helix domain-containing protein [Novosphingobium album (ex Liu et al. 2023)]
MKPRKPRKIRQFWLKQLHTWHWISAAVSLIGMFLFAITGITLNHAATISAAPQVTARQAMLPPAQLPLLANPPASDAPLPAPVAGKIKELVGLDPAGRPGEWSDEEVYVAMPGPGSDAWVSLDRATGAIEAEYTDRGWISYLNDLHKGRNSGTAWFWFIDVFAVACLIFTITGLLLLQIHARHRPSTWPLVALGTAIPVIIALFLIH